MQERKLSMSELRQVIIMIGRGEELPDWMVQQAQDYCMNVDNNPPEEPLSPIGPGRNG